MYVGRRHTVTATARKLFPFKCAFCKHEAFALVTGVGQGEGNSPYFLDEGGAKERAGSQANANAVENAEATLKLARCPSCFQRDESALRTVKLKAVAGAIASLVFLVGMGLLLDAGRRSSIGLYIFVPIAIFTSVFLYRSQTWKWETVDNRVTFFGKEDLEAADAGD